MTPPKTHPTLFMHDANIAHSEFVNVRLPSARFDDVNLQGAAFTNTNLSDATLSDVNLSNVSVTNANLAGMKIDGVLVDDMLEAYRSRAGNAGTTKG